MAGPCGPDREPHESGLLRARGPLEADDGLVRLEGSAGVLRDLGHLRPSPRVGHHDPRSKRARRIEGREAAAARVVRKSAPVRRRRKKMVHALCYGLKNRAVRALKPMFGRLFGRPARQRVALRRRAGNNEAVIFAAVIGAVSGYYIFQPAAQQAGQHVAASAPGGERGPTEGPRPAQ